jgi:Tfp pilus assembly protein PilX
MSPLKRTLARLRDQRGFAIPMAIMLLAVMVTMIGAAAVAAISSRSAAQTDLNAVGAQQAADAGLRIASYEYNSLGIDSGMVFAPQTKELNKPIMVKGLCYVANSATGTGAPVADEVSGQWCNPVTGTLGEGANWSYVISQPSQTVLTNTTLWEKCVRWIILCVEWDSQLKVEVTRTIVATGRAGNEVRSVEQKYSMLGESIECWGILFGLCFTKKGGITQYYTPILKTYENCTRAAASVPEGQSPESYC